VTATGNPTATGIQTSTGARPDAGGGTADAGGGRNDGSSGAGGTAGTPLKLGHAGCACDLGSASTGSHGGPGFESLLGLLGAILIWRRSRKRH
jgi:hypothetical protein